MERVTVRMARSDRRTPWGFGVTEAPDRSVVIVNVVGGSLADRAGLRNGDILDKLEELGDLDIMAVDRLLVTSLDKIELVVHRAASGPARIWRPEIRETNDADRPYAVNLEHNSDSRPPQGFNASALPFETDSRVKHLQYNSPLGLYSDSAAAEQYVQQTTGYVEGDQRSARSVAQKEQQPSYLRSETLKQIKAEEGGRGASTLSSHPNPDGLPVCFVCQRPILGVMARAQGRDLHGDCLACATCGNSLRNVGHHFIDEKFYCDVHAAQKRGASLSRGSVDPNLVARTPPTAAQPTRPSEPPRSFYQPEVLSSRPLSVSPVPTSGTTVITHYSTPKTQGIINPQNRGVPTAIFGADLKTTQTYGGSSTGMGGTVYGAGGGAGSGTGIGVQGAGYGQGAGAGLGSGNYNNFSSQQSQTRTIPVQQAPPPIPSTQPPSINTQGNQGYTRTVTERTEKTVTNGAGSGAGLGADYDNSGQTTNFTSNIRTNTSGSLHSGATGGRIPYCEACKQQIRGAFVLATGLAWCPEHFVCANSSCGRRLLECGFVEESGRKYCEGCFEAHIAPRCAKCAKPIVSDCLNALQKKWHPTCFTCAHCQKPFGNSAFYLEQGLPYCERDWNALFTTKCISCSYPIEAGDRWVEALGQAFHSNCFNCSRCHANLEGESFYARNGQPFCRLHA